MPDLRLRLFGGIELSAHDDGRERRIAVSPKPRAMLAYLAVASVGAMPVRRDVLLALFWPELPARRARAALRQLLFHLRRDVGERALYADREVVSLAPGAIASDLGAFEDHLARGERVEAVTLYRGPLLEGFHLDGASRELEAWIDERRSSVSGEVLRACWGLTTDARRAGNAIDAIHWARKAVALAPDDEIAVRGLIEVLMTFGDRVGALRVAGDFARRVAQDFGTVPSAETRALVLTIRSGGDAAR